FQDLFLVDALWAWCEWAGKRSKRSYPNTNVFPRNILAVANKVFLTGKSFGNNLGGNFADMSHAKSKYESTHCYASARIDRGNKIPGGKFTKAFQTFDLRSS